jgi:hypothetical protein
MPRTSAVTLLDRAKIVFRPGTKRTTVSLILAGEMVSVNRFAVTHHQR